MLYDEEVVSIDKISDIITEQEELDSIKEETITYIQAIHKVRLQLIKKSELIKYIFEDVFPKCNFETKDGRYNIIKYIYIHSIILDNQKDNDKNINENVLKIINNDDHIKTFVEKTNGYFYTFIAVILLFTDSKARFVNMKLDREIILDNKIKLSVAQENMFHKFTRWDANRILVKCRPHCLSVRLFYWFLTSEKLSILSDTSHPQYLDIFKIVLEHSKMEISSTERCRKLKNNLSKFIVIK